jgi:hypothetical protein
VSLSQVHNHFHRKENIHGIRPAGRFQARIAGADGTQAPSVDKTMSRLETLEPDLTEVVLEELTEIHRQLLDLGGPPKKSRLLYRRIQSLVLLSITALQKAHYRLWQTEMGGRLEELDSTNEPPAIGDEPSPDTLP